MTEITVMFWEFRQNNPGGFFQIDNDTAEQMWFEATDYEDANLRAQRWGLRLDGDECPGCCGSRWSSQYTQTDGKETPEEWTSTGRNDGRIMTLPEVQERLVSLNGWSTWGVPGNWTKPGSPWAIVIYMDGRVERFIKPEPVISEVGEKEDGNG